MSDKIIDHINDCLDRIKKQKKQSTKEYAYTNLEVALFMSILFNEVYTEDDIHRLCDGVIRKIRRILHTNRVIKNSLLEDLSYNASKYSNYKCNLERLYFDIEYFEI